MPFTFTPTPDPICPFCGCPVTDTDFENGNYEESSVGECHASCLDTRLADTRYR